MVLYCAMAALRSPSISSFFLAASNMTLAESGLSAAKSVKAAANTRAASEQMCERNRIGNCLLDSRVEPDCPARFRPIVRIVYDSGIETVPHARSEEHTSE